MSPGPALKAQVSPAGYWSSRARAETIAALRCDDPHIAALHVELATNCVRKMIESR